MTITQINKLYADGFDCDTDVQFDDNTLMIFIGNRASVEVRNIDKATACVIAEDLLNKWDFSYYLEFDNEEEYYQFMK
jgi:hypothetical protein